MKKTDAAAEQPSRPKGQATALDARLEELAARIARLDRWLVLLVLVLAFMLGSFTARNSDFWRQLATGRFLVEGKYTFGVDPFAHTTSDAYWVNHSWLYDLGLYALNMLARGPEEFGGTVSVVLKALMVAALAGLLLTLRRGGQSFWAPVSCVTLALLAMAPRLTLQPVCVSLFFLGLTLFILAREGKKEANSQPTKVRGLRVLFTSSPRRLYALPLLFALWVNLDQWFWLGPFCIALFLLGEKLQQMPAPKRSGADAPDQDEYRTLLAVLGLGLAACLLNPHHLRVFTLPPELLPRVFFPGMGDDPHFRAYYLTPFSSAYLSRAFGLNVAGLAYYPLLVLGLLSFGLTWHDLRMWRVLVFFGFAVLSMTSMLAIPFFAVVAGPITALNLQDFCVGYFGSGVPVGGRVQRLLLAGRLLTIVTGIALLLAAWPGWLQPFPGDPYRGRRVAWGVEVNPSLKSVCYKLDYWRAQGLLRPEDHGFNFLPEIAHYCAWFCPEEKGFLDGRFALFPAVAAGYGDLRYVLNAAFGQPPDSERVGPAQVPDWQKVLRKHGVNHLILTGPSWEATRVLVGRLLADPEQWPLLYLDGRTTVFGWNDPQLGRSNRFARLRLDPGPLAFGPDAEQAPRQGPGRLPQADSWWDRYLTGTAPPTLDADRAAMELLYFDVVRQRWHRRYDQEWRVLAIAGVFGTGNPAAGALPALPAVYGRLFVGNLDGPRSYHLLDRDPGPPALPLLAVRAGWRGVAANPDDLDAYFALFRALDAVGTAQENHWAKTLRQPSQLPSQLLKLLKDREPLDAYLSPWISRRVSSRQLLRRVQVLSCLHALLARQPDAPRVHELLFTIYWGMNYYDLALDHLRAEIRSLESAGARLMSAAELTRALGERRQLLRDCEKELDELQLQYDIDVAQSNPDVQALVAFQPFGLANLALSILLRDPAGLKDRQAVDLAIYLLLTTGRAAELRNQLTDVQKAALGPLSFEVYHMIQSAALGDYDEAGAHLEQALSAIAPPRGNALLQLLQGMTFGNLQPHLFTRRTLLLFVQQQAFEGHRSFVTQQQRHELLALRGLLALDVGDTATAARFFELSLTATGPRYSFESEPIAANYLALLRRFSRAPR